MTNSEPSRRPLEFRFAYFTPEFETTVEFYGRVMGFPLVDSWQRSPDDRGAVFLARVGVQGDSLIDAHAGPGDQPGHQPGDQQTSGGLIEVLHRPQGRVLEHQWDPRPPQGAFLVIELPGVDATWAEVKSRGAKVVQEIRDQEWGHRNFCVADPNGIVLCLFSKLP